MGNSWTELVTSSVVILVLCISAFLSLQKPQAPTGGFLSPRRCIGVFHPQLGMALVFPSPGDDIVSLAQEKLGISKGCPRPPQSPDTGELESETVILFNEENNDCVFQGFGRLSEAEGLLCGGRIDLNQARETDLVLLPGIGPSRARKIIEWREKNGPFFSLESLSEVTGIGEKTVQDLRNWVEW